MKKLLLTFLLLLLPVVCCASTSTKTITITVIKKHSVSLTWIASTSTVAGYNIYRGTASGGPYAKINTALVTGTSFIDSTVASATTYFYVSTSVNSAGDESTNSNQATAVIPNP